MGFIAWVLVSYVPFIVSAISTSPLQMVAVLFKEIYRLRKVGGLKGLETSVFALRLQEESRWWSRS